MEAQQPSLGLFSEEARFPNKPSIASNDVSKPRLLDEASRLAKHPIFELGNALFRGNQDDRALRLYILDRMIEDAGNSIANDGVMRDMSIPDIAQLVADLPQETVADAVRWMSQADLLECQGKFYQVAPLTTVLVQFVRFVAHMQDETGASAAVVSSIFNYQLEIGSQANPNSSQPDKFIAIKSVILEIGRYNAHLEDVIRHSVIADLDAIVKDLSAVNYFCGILDGLVNQMAKDSQPGDVYWLERARRMIRRLRDLIDSLQRAYSGRISKSLSGTGRFVTDEVLERWLIHAISNEKEQITEWIGKLDNPAYVNIFPCWLLETIADEGPQMELGGENPDKKPLISTITLSDSTEAGSLDEEQVMNAIREMKAAILKKESDSVQLLDLLDTSNWLSSAIRICHLGTALEIIEREENEKWAVDSANETIQFEQGLEVASVSKAEIGLWTYLTQKKIARAG